jgi:hypothetical protein
MTLRNVGPVDHPELNRRRKAVDAGRRNLRQATVALQDAQAALANVQRSAHRDADKIAAARAAAQEKVGVAATARAEAAAELDRAVAQLGKLVVAALPPTPEEEIARLKADRPIVLLPIRLETRFSGNELLLRIYPDDIFADSHEPELTDGEVEDGQRFWQTAWPGEAAERLAWRVLVDAVGAPRAAWVAEQTQPSNVRQRPGEAPVFGAVVRRGSAWTFAAEARLLPDRWIVVLQRNGAKPRIETSEHPVREPLALTMSADTAEPRSALSDGLQVDDASRWTVDFSAAEDVGMGIRIKISEAERAAGFERVIVLGVKSSVPPNRTAGALRQLIDNHRYGRGVAILPQGTPTNNTAASASAFPPPDPDGSASFATARRVVAPLDGREGGRLMRALGLPAKAAEHWSGAAGRSDQVAAAMARALSPATLRYFMEQMMAPVFGAEAVALTHSFFVEHVRGPLPAFRIGNTPYGVLPVSSIALWRAGDEDNALDRELPQALRALLPLWSEQIDNVPRVGRTGDPDADLCRPPKTGII